MTTYVRTAYFKDLRSACKYYKDYGFDKETVKNKIKEGEIFIGKPNCYGPAKLVLNNENRYEIVYNCED